MKLNEFITSTEKKKSDNFEIDQRTSFKISESHNDEHKYFKKYNTINFNEKNEISSTQNFQYTSPQINKKKQSHQRTTGGKNMTKTTVFLQAINDVKDFVTIVMHYDFDIDLVSGRYAVDAKSIMGIFSLDLSKPIQLNAHTDDADKFLKEIDRFIVK